LYMEANDFMPQGMESVPEDLRAIAAACAVAGLAQRPPERGRREPQDERERAAHRAFRSVSGSG
ncbi:MAG: hypothetical protein KC613_25575, partial [Myxococcales bacterium]|nr:hypothetical protein [Myxococcales bacterium]